MTIDAFIAALAEELPALPPDGLSPDTDFRSLAGWDSLAGLMVLTMMGTRFGVEMNPADLRACRTIRDLHSWLASRLPRHLPS